MSNFEEFEELKFLTINTPILWKQGYVIEGNLEFLDTTDNGHYSNTGGINLSGFTEFIRTESFQIPITTVIDLDLDLECDIFYILDKETGKLMIYDFRSGYFEWVKCLKFDFPKSIRAGKENIYILNENHLFIINKTNFQIRRIFEGISANPLEIAIDSKEENVFILDTQEKQIYQVSILDNAVYTLLTDDEKRNAISNASSIFVGSKDNKIYVLDCLNKKVIVFPSSSVQSDNTEEETGCDILSLDGPLEFIPSDVAVRDKQNIFIGDIGTSKDYTPNPRKYSNSKISQVLEYNRTSHKIILDRKDSGLYVVNFSDNLIIKFELVNRFLSYGSYLSQPLDSGIQGLKWHKFVLDMEIPDPVNTKVEVFYYASDRKSDPTDIQWIKTQFSNPTDSLMFDTIGRYLWLKFSLFSNDNRTTPIIYAVKAYLPRLSYLKYLPTIYQENYQSKEFLERFLSIFETFFVQIEELNFTQYIDPRSTPDEFIPWLSSWLAIAYDENWPKKNFRKLIEMAPQIYKMRGTRKGIEKMLSLYLYAPEEESDQELSEIGVGQESKFMIIENFQLDPVKNNPEYMRLFCNNPYTFCVIFHPFYIDERKKLVIRKIIESEKPAHTAGNIIFLEPWFYLGAHTYLGINTVLQDSNFILGDSAISRDTILSRKENSGNIGTSRIGIDTHIF